MLTVRQQERSANVPPMQISTSANLKPVDDSRLAEILADFRWWLSVAERWSEPPPKRPRTRRPAEPLADQPKRLLRLLGLPR